MKNLLNFSTDSVFGLVVKRCNIRRVHNNQENIDSDGFDINQESALLPFSLVKIQNKWENYFYIKSHVASGWVDSSSIALISNQQARELFFPEHFCVITEPTITLCGVDYYMSCKIPLVDGYLQIPDFDGSALSFRKCPPKEGCHTGYLPFSRNTVLSQAVKFLKTPYDWGEKNGGLDCSALVMYSFACCGIILPRQSSEQAKVTFPVSVYSVENAHLASPADILYSPGHVMLSMGDRYIIHASASAGKVCIGRV